MKRFPAIVIAFASVVACGATAAVVSAGGGKATDPVGVHITPLSHGTIPGKVFADHAGIEIRTKGPRDLLVTAMTIDPAGTFGWHTHPGPVLVAISKGTLTVYEAHGTMCMRKTVSAGQGFVEDGGHVHMARNEGSDPVELNATFLARTGTTEFLTPVPEPKACNV